MLAAVSTLLLSSLALLAPVSEPTPLTETATAATAASDEGAEHVDHREGDSGLFMDLFGHLEPHPVFGVWFGGDSLVSFPDIHVYDADGESVGYYHSPEEMREALSAQMGGGTGFLIYNINTVKWMAAIVLVLIFIPVAARAKARHGEAPRGGAYGLMESLCLFVRDEMVYAVMGKENGRRLVPLFLTQFFFILFMNILGLMPLGGIGGTATANLAVTGGLAMTTLLWIHMAGIRQFGVAKHFQNFIPHGLPWFVLPIIIPVEIMGMLVKPIALTIRLFANLTAGHLIVLGLFGLVYFFNSHLIALPVMGMAVAIYCLELFVCFVQAYIFTYLSIVFVGASVHPDH